MESKKEPRFSKRNDFRQEVEGYRWSRSKGKWIPFKKGIVFPKKKKTLSIISYNILFDKFIKEDDYNENRTNFLMKILEEENADFVFLQEVKKNLLEEILKQPWVQKRYCLSCNESSFIFEDEGFGNVIMSKIPFFELYIYSFSRFKTYVNARFRFEHYGDVVVNNIHLSASYHGEERVDSSAKRKSQLMKVYNRVRDEGNVIIAGDFNFSDIQPEHEFMMNNFLRFKDCWMELNSKEEREKEPFYTFDTVINPTSRKTCGEELKQKRLDRILFKSVLLKVKSLKMLGREVNEFERDGKGIKFCPSDHFGVYAKFGLP